MKNSNLQSFRIFFILFIFSLFGTILPQDDYDEIDSDSCVDCHELSKHNSNFVNDIEHSVHEDLECQDCHSEKTIYPHEEDTDPLIGCEGCRTCHEDESDDYTVHGRESVGDCGDIPTCASCHGDHDILPSSAKASKVHPTNLPKTCGACHEDLDLIKKHEMLLDHPVTMYSNACTEKQPLAEFMLLQLVTTAIQAVGHPIRSIHPVIQNQPSIILIFQKPVETAIKE